MDKQHYDLIVVGAGAAGLFCAATAGQAGLRVLVLEKAKKAGRKILMSGGGRCNFTNLDVTPDNFLCQNPHFVKSALQQYTHWEFIALVERYQIPYHERDLGKLFCDRSAKDILAMLLAECRLGQVSIHTDTEINGFEAGGAEHQLHSSAGVFCAKSVAFATGGLSIPSMRGTGLAYQVAEQLGHQLIPRRAGLVPFVLDGRVGEWFSELSGNALPVTLHTDEASFTEPMLITHRGLSGPCALQASSYWHAGQPVSLNVLPDYALSALFLSWKQQYPNAQLRSRLAQLLPRKWVLGMQQRWWAKRADTPLANWPDSELLQLADKLSDWQIYPAGTEGYKTAEVTLGGVATDEIRSRSMESQRCDGVYFLGEALDVTGHLGGYNFQWAWSSAVVAARDIASKHG